MRKPHRYPEVESSPDFAGLEEKILEQWQQDDAFRRSVDRRPERVDGKSNRYVFYDGPPFANGLPHYGHLLTGYVKDAIARYWTMRGKHVERRFGWDCHGLPAEMGAEKELKLSGRAAILEYGIEKFNAHCRSSVMQYVADWRYYVTRQGRWVDFDHDYKTMDTSYMESVLWAFKQLYDKGLVYESMRVMPYSWAAETPLSNFETKLDNSYRDRDDKAAYVKFKLKDKPPRFVPEELEKSGVRIENYYLVAWTTTPWTLPANLALAVNPEMKYSYTVIPAQAGISREAGARGEGDSRLRGNDVLITASFAEPEVVGYLDTPVRWEIEGRDLIGLSYEPLFPFFKDISPNAFKIYAADFVTEGDGTGVVHMAPGFGEDDHRLAQEKGIPTVVPVDGRGFYTSEVGEFAGLHVIWDEASNHKHTGNEAVLKNLKERGLLLKQETYRHSYPHCWRTDTPLIYRAMSSWYVAVTKFRDRAVEINKTIDWIPEHVRDGQMHHMLATAPDWSISRNRFWGAPIPIWRSPSGKVKAFGSIAEIEAASGKKVTDLHRPFIDEIVIVEDGEEFRRVEDVFDCWFESGSMPYAQLHYPFENKERFEENFPADFITEYVGQTRGWFNTLLMLSTELFGCAPFKHCICHGVVLDDKGQKLSKRAGNYADPKMLFDTFGADALRWFMLSSPVMRGGEMHIDKEGRFIRDVVRLAVKPIWNAYHFFTLYANADGVEARDYLRHMENFGVSPNLMDAYILTKCQVAVEQIGASLDAYDTPGATDAVTAFFEVLNNWYIRRSRPRFWAEEGSPQKRSAYDTLFTVLNALVVASAPLLPFLCETVYQGLNDTKESVHWQDFPDLGGAITALTNEGPMSNTSWPAGSVAMAMDIVRDACTAAHGVRNQSRRRTRQPLQTLTIVAPSLYGFREYGEMVELIKDEVNVKEVIFQQDIRQFATRRIQINSAVLGKRLPEKMKQILPASKKGEWKLEEGAVEIVGEKLLPGEYTILLEPKPEFKDSAMPLASNDALVVLDLTITPELEAEGLARDLVRIIQQARKDAGMDVSDRIDLAIQIPPSFRPALAHAEYIRAQTLAVSLAEGKAASEKEITSELDGETFVIGISKAAA